MTYIDRMTPDFETQLRAVSLRVTRPRLSVLAALRDHPHVDTERMIGLVRAQQPTVSHQTVYDVLRALTDAGLIRRIQPAGAIARYESRVGDNHHHVVCRSCGSIADVDCTVGHAPCLTASDDHGFVIDEAEVVYWGTCSECAAGRFPSDPPVGGKADERHPGQRRLERAGRGPDIGGGLAGRARFRDRARQRE
jgi:Fur family ferric uptake transcriptional regulator